MKHGIKKIKFNGGQDANEALMRKLVISFVQTGKLSTTLSKAKALKSEIDKLVYKASLGRESDRNVLLRKLGNRNVVKHMLTVVGPTFVGQQSGYTRLFRMGPRQGDNAEVARLEWIKPLIELVPTSVEKEVKKLSKKTVTKTNKAQ